MTSPAAATSRTLSPGTSIHKELPLPICTAAPNRSPGSETPGMRQDSCVTVTSGEMGFAT
ncbi:MAG: hypothetical protein ACJ72A_18725 [Nocardioidaceae bacterium]